jgi:hypothetical protein
MYEPSGLIFHDHSIISLPYAAACEAVWAIDVFAFTSSFLSVDGMPCHISF